MFDVMITNYAMWRDWTFQFSQFTESSLCVFFSQLVSIFNISYNNQNKQNISSTYALLGKRERFFFQTSITFECHQNFKNFIRLKTASNYFSRDKKTFHLNFHASKMSIRNSLYHISWNLEKHIIKIPKNDDE
jgi:hypothetical protein